MLFRGGFYFLHLIQQTAPLTDDGFILISVKGGQNYNAVKEILYDARNVGTFRRM
jgi:hypothetical protein